MHFCAANSIQDPGKFMLTTKAQEKHRCQVNIKAYMGSDGGGTSDSSAPGRRVMTTPRQRQQIHNEERSTLITNKNTHKIGP